MRISRRRWLLGAALGLGALGLARYVLWDKLGSLQPKELAAFLRKEFSYLKLEDDAPERFARVFVQHDRIGRGLLTRLRGGDMTWQQAELTSMGHRFLLSTDFFLNGADENRPVRFVAYYDPYITPCWNPVRAHRAAKAP